jgi:DNA-binding transcriptional MerR regulator
VYKEPVIKTVTSQRYSLDELAALVDLPKRTIRYYVQIGLVDRPTGETRAAYYTGTHAEQLIAIRKWSASGLSLERIREVLRGAEAPAPARPRSPGSVEVWSHLVVADGVELTIEPTRAGLSPRQVRALFREVGAVFERITNKETEEE